MFNNDSNVTFIAVTTIIICDYFAHNYCLYISKILYKLIMYHIIMRPAICLRKTMLFVITFILIIYLYTYYMNYLAYP